MAVDPRTLKVGDTIRIGSHTKIKATEIKDEVVSFDDNSIASFDGLNGADPFWAICRKDGSIASDGVAGHPRFLALLDQLRAMHLAKSADYGTSDDIFSNFRGSAALGVAPWVGAMIRAKDKVRRIQSFVGNGTLKNEPLMDSFLDLASYALIAAVLFEEAKDGSK